MLLSANEVSAERTVRSGDHDADPLSFRDDDLDDDDYDVFRMLFCVGGVISFVQCVWHSISELVLICLALVRQSHCSNSRFFFLCRQSNSTSQFPAHHIISSNRF